MTQRVSKLLCIAVAMAATSVAAVAQRPSPSEAQALLQARPELATQVRQRLMTSGMSADQVRQRLRAEGYPENFLDAYLPGGAGNGAAPTSDIVTALERLGISSNDDATVMRTMLRQQPAAANRDASPAVVTVRDDVERTAEQEKASYALFGLSLFRNATSEFIPVMDGPVGPDYRLGPGDELVLILTGEVELAHTLPITREGFIVIPQVGQLSVANLTMSQLEDLLYERLARSYSGVRRGADARTKFSVSVSRLRAIQVFVTGDVARPSSYRVASTATAMTALYAAGGPTEEGTFRAVTVRRGGAVVATVDLYDYLLKGERGSDRRLENGDIVFVGPHGPRVRVTGEVIRPATYELRAGEGVRDALVSAGGFRPTAVTSRVLLTRLVPPAERGVGGQDRVVIDVAAGASGGIASYPSLPLTGGDELRALPISDRVRGRVSVLGHVWNAGSQGFRTGLKLSDALRQAGGLKPDAYLGQVSITRLRPDSTRIQLRTALRDTTGQAANDLLLQEDDEITVFSLTEFRPDRYVAIGGSVRRSGQYPWREGMTLRDLVLSAGGLRAGAYLREAEVARVPEDRRGGHTAVTLRVPLDSSYIGDYVAGVPYPGPLGEATAGSRSTAEVALQPYDNVLIMQQPDWETPRSVVLTGEVRFPGRYTLVSKTETLSDLVKRAGGFTPAAAVDAAYFGRQTAATSFRRGVEMDSTQTVSFERSRVGLALGRAMRQRGSTDDLVLINGDSLDVPSRRSTVEIRGAVNAPTVITHEGKRIGYYIRASGGGALNGSERRAYVIQPNGKIQARQRLFWLIPLDPKPREGATVVVPVEADNSQNVQRIALTVQIVAQTLASIATVLVLLR
ncbi:MAG: SLBB domain-containing protein [Gemmatimonadetes bacterium]|nr:SLBB domain-containing protein [Gemmatimonadota bacterium]